MQALRSSFSNKGSTSCDKYLNFTLNYFKLNPLSDDITFVYVNCVIVIDPEHPNLCEEISCIAPATFLKEHQSH